MNSFTNNHKNLMQFPTNRTNIVPTNSANQRHFNITPINLSQIEKELDEARDDSDCSPVSKPEPFDLVPSNTSRHDSFDLNFSALSLTTPAKSKPGNNYNSQSINLKEDPLSHHFITPRVREEPSSVKKIVYSTPTSSFYNSATKQVNNAFSTKSKRVQNRRVSNLPSFPEQNDENALPCPRCKLLESIKTIITVNKNEFGVLGLLGKGGSSEVFECYNLSNKMVVAIKVVSLTNESANGYINEVKVLQKLQNCDKIIKMFDYELKDYEKKLYVILEKGGKDLSTILKQVVAKNASMPYYKLLFYWMEMLYAVKQIHMNGIIHSDLKPGNFIQSDGGLKLIDFGIASCVASDMTSVVKCAQEGSCNYISPEALKHDTSSNINSPNYGTVKYKVNYKSDVWSLGCILYQLVYMKTPFQHITQLWPKLAEILNPNHVIEYPPAGRVSSKIIQTIKKCLQYDVAARPSIDDLITEYEEIL